MAGKGKAEQRSFYNKGYNAGKTAGLKQNGNGHVPTNGQAPVPSKPVEVLIERGSLVVTIKET